MTPDMRGHDERDISNTLSRRQWLGTIVIGACASCLVARAAAAKTEKTAKDKASYQDQPKGKQAMCSTCKFFMPPAACLVVEGTISPSGWCQLYEKKEA